MEYVLAGAFAGFLVGLTGIGGGAIMTPILLLVFKIEPITAVATDLWYAAITKCFSSYSHFKNQQIHFQVVKDLWKGSLVACIIIAVVINMHLLDAAQYKILVPIIAIMVVISALMMMFHGLLIKKDIFAYTLSPTKQKVLTIASGALIGTLVSLTSIGAGVLGTIMLLYLYPKRLTPSNIVGTETLHAIPLAFLAGLSYFISGKTDWHLLANLLVGSIPAAMLGSTLASRISSKFVRFGLSTALLASGLKMLM